MAQLMGRGDREPFGVDGVVLGLPFTEHIDAGVIENLEQVGADYDLLFIHRVLHRIIAPFSSC
jgi:hypothetical protein